jgi:hypothetical protein
MLVQYCLPLGCSCSVSASSGGRNKHLENRGVTDVE